MFEICQQRTGHCYLYRDYKMLSWQLTSTVWNRVRKFIQILNTFKSVLHLLI